MIHAFHTTFEDGQKQIRLELGRADGASRAKSEFEPDETIRFTANIDAARYGAIVDVVDFRIDAVFDATTGLPEKGTATAGNISFVPQRVYVRGKPWEK